MTESAGHIIVVDDDPSLRQMLTRFLEEHSVPVKAASGRTELNRHLKSIDPALIMLDLRLGQDDGLELLRDIRSSSDVPVIVMTGHRSDEIDRIVGLELGQPFSQRKCSTRVHEDIFRSQYRRQGSSIAATVWKLLRVCRRDRDRRGFGLPVESCQESSSIARRGTKSRVLVTL